MVDGFSIFCTLVDHDHCTMECVLSSWCDFSEVNVIHSKPDVHSFLHKMWETKSTILVHPLKNTLLRALFKVKDPPVVTPNVHFCEVIDEALVTYSGMNGER